MSLSYSRLTGILLDGGTVSACNRHKSPESLSRAVSQPQMTQRTRGQRRPPTTFPAPTLAQSCPFASRHLLQVSGQSFAFPVTCSNSQTWFSYSPNSRILFSPQFPLHNLHKNQFLILGLLCTEFLITFHNSRGEDRGELQEGGGRRMPALRA